MDVGGGVVDQVGLRLLEWEGWGVISEQKKALVKVGYGGIVNKKVSVGMLNCKAGARQLAAWDGSLESVDLTL